LNIIKSIFKTKTFNIDREEYREKKVKRYYPIDWKNSETWC